MLLFNSPHLQSLIAHVLSAKGQVRRSTLGIATLAEEQVPFDYDPRHPSRQDEHALARLVSMLLSDRAGRKVVMSKKAERRHHRARMIARARKSTIGKDLDPERIVRMADNLKVCSCHSFDCGNRRRGWNGPVLTWQERIADLHLREEIEESRVVSKKELEEDEHNPLS